MLKDNIIATTSDYCLYCHNPGQIKAELSTWTWSGNTIGKIPHHTTIQAIQYYVNFTVQRRTTSYDYHCIPGEILSHFYVRQSSEIPIWTILDAL